MQLRKTLITLLLTALPLHTFAHGEDKAGPHGGFIRMPGAYHTEVVPEKKGYRVYLLDINWKNPTVQNSSVSASIHSGKKITALTCTKETESYFCSTNLPQSGELQLLTKRAGQPGATASYKLPLKLESPKVEMPEHTTQQHQGH